MSRPIPDILVGVATYREINTKTVGSIHQMMMVLKNCRWGYTMTDTVNTPMARNMITRGFLDTEADYLFFIDQDMVFQPHHAERLIEAIEDNPEAGCVTGFYTKRDGSSIPLCGWLDEDRPWMVMENDLVLDRLEASRGKLIEADVLPTGFMIIRREAIEAIKEPWFHIDYPITDTGERHTEMWSSDTVFCHKVRQAGFKTMVHLGIEVGHIGDFIYLPHYFWQSLPQMRTIAQRDAIKYEAAQLYGVNTPEYWDSVWKAEQDLRFERQYDALHAEICNLFHDGTKLLDIGCGSGQFMRVARDRKGCDVMGLDQSRAGVEICKADGMRAEVFDITTDSLPPAMHKAFDVVVCTEVVEHLEDETKLLKMAHAALKPGGVFILSCPANCQGPNEEPEHVRVVTDEDVTQWFSVYEDFELAKVNHYWLAVGRKRVKDNALHKAASRSGSDRQVDAVCG